MGCTLFLQGCLCIAYILWVSFSINALVGTTDADIRHVCESSNLWACLITMVILTILRILKYICCASSKKEEEEVEASTTACCQLIVWAALTIWIGVELFNPCAIKHKPTTVYQMLLIHFWSTVSFISLGLLYLICGCGSEEKKEPLLPRGEEV